MWIFYGFLLLLCLGILVIYLVWIGKIRLSFGKICFTKKGERVKSGGEKCIADWLYSQKIQYVYEKPLYMGVGKKKIRVRPDFYLPEYDVYIEYRGMIGHMKYMLLKRKKERQYRENNIQLISLYPSEMKEIGKVLPKKLKQYSKK